MTALKKVVLEKMRDYATLIIRQQQDVLELQQTRIALLNEITHAVKDLHPKNNIKKQKDTNNVK